MCRRRFEVNSVRAILLAASLPAVISPVAHGATSTWNTNQIGSWSVNDNWMGGSPITGDGAYVSSGMGTVDVPFDLGTLTLAGGMIGGLELVQISNAFAWQAGNLEGSGTIQIKSTGTMSATAAIQSTRLFRSIENFGTIHWSSTASLETGGGAIFANHGTLNFASDSTLGQEQGGSPLYMLFDNSGWLTKSAGSGSTSLQGKFQNTGTIIVQQGTLNIVTKLVGASESGSTLDIGAGSTLQFGGVGVWLKTGITVSGAGTLENIGALRANASLLAARSVLMNGTELAIDGGNADLNTASFTWNRGFLSGPGLTKLSSNITFNDGWGVVGGRTLDTDGFNLTWNGSGFGGTSAFGFTGAGTIENRAASTFTYSAQTNSLSSLGTGDAAAYLNNAGTFDVRNAGTLAIHRPVTNSGTIVTNSGTFLDNLNAPQTAPGTVSLLGGIISSGAITGPGSVVIAGATNSFTSSSTINIASLKLLAGTTTLSNSTAGAYQTSGQTVVGDAAELSTPAILMVSPGVLFSAGSTQLVGAGQVDVNGGSINGAVHVGRLLTGDSPTLTIHNSGRVTGSAVIVNAGTLDLQSGTITASSSFAIAGGTANFSGSAAHLTAPALSLTAGQINVGAGFTWPASALSTSGSTIRLMSGVSYSFASASVISAGGLVIDSGASLAVPSMQHGGNSDVSGSLAVTGAITLQNSGVLQANTGGTISANAISGDGLLLGNNGTISAPGGISLTVAGALIGAGTINANTTIAGALAPGTESDPTGDLHINGNLTLESAAVPEDFDHPGSSTYFTVDATTPTIQWSRVEVSGTSTLGGFLIIYVSGDLNNLPMNVPVTLLHSAGGRFGVFDSIDIANTNDLGAFVLQYTADSVQLVYIPEPATSALMLFTPFIPRRKRRR